MQSRNNQQLFIVLKKTIKRTNTIGQINLIIISLIFCVVLSSCKFSEDQSKDTNISKEPSALGVVEKAINKAGTLERWQNIKSLTYTKKSRLLLENGEVESEVVQNHHYEFYPEKNIKIRWVVGKDSFLIVHNDTVSQKFKNHSLVAEGTTIKSSVNSSLYVLGMPFKLLDAGTNLSYEGLKTFNGFDTLQVVKATYAPKVHKNHSTQDEWWYHFDNNDGTFLSSLVYHEPTYALIENLERTEVGGLSFPAIRKSYRCDKEGNKQFLRAEFWYTDYSISFVDDEQ